MDNWNSADWPHIPEKLFSVTKIEIQLQWMGNIGGGGNSPTGFNMIELTLNTQTTIFCIPLVLQSTYLEGALQSTGTIEWPFFLFISVSCGICFPTDVQMEINFWRIYTDINVTFDLRKSQHKISDACTIALPLALPWKFSLVHSRTDSSNIHSNRLLLNI